MRPADEWCLGGKEPREAAHGVFRYLRRHSFRLWPCGEWLGSASRYEKRRSPAGETAQEASTSSRGSAPFPDLWLRAGRAVLPGAAPDGRYSGKTCQLLFKLVLSVAFFVAELVSGYLGNSIALLSDSFNMLSDLISLCGYARAEVVGALSNAVFLIALCFTIFVEAMLRLAQPERIDDPELVLIVGALGLLVNMVGLLIFQDCAAWFLCCRRGRGRRLQQRQQLAEDSAPGAFRGLQGPEDMRRA
ncbi:hypothetical protein P7K49_036102 [Saguinus oedipus]|uniref:Cation efflux protein transmembrane domain-containing protein n=1 Tax=Saguinus oedipus TaxID=9490 RepID=A0ABQ9TR81_SAGOE|nr:hypothetical protein P7K49_036102 [Saguinus oedipus]